MKNPCEECLVKVNCTAICPDKTNFKVWITTSVNNYRQWHVLNRGKKNNTLSKIYTGLIQMERQNFEDENDIINRAAAAKGFDVNIIYDTFYQSFNER